MTSWSCLAMSLVSLISSTTSLVWPAALIFVLDPLVESLRCIKLPREARPTAARQPQMKSFDRELIEVGCLLVCGLREHTNPSVWLTRVYLQPVRGQVDPTVLHRSHRQTLSALVLPALHLRAAYQTNVPRGLILSLQPRRAAKRSRAPVRRLWVRVYARAFCTSWCTCIESLANTRAMCWSRQ